MSELALTILPETPADALAIERLNERTFGPGRFAKSAYRLRESRGHVLALSFTARIGSLLIGSVRLTPICIGDTPALLLGPLTVEPPFRERGVGRALVERALKDAKAAGHRWWCWSATSRSTASPASSASRRARPRCRVRSIQRACWWPNSRPAPSPACGDDPAGVGYRLKTAAA